MQITAVATIIRAGDEQDLASLKVDPGFGELASGVSVTKGCDPRAPPEKLVPWTTGQISRDALARYLIPGACSDEGCACMRQPIGIGDDGVNLLGIALVSGMPGKVSIAAVSHERPVNVRRPVVAPP
jgi:hypothetical protein